MGAHRILISGHDRPLRVAPWRGDERTAYLVPTGPRPSLRSIERSLHALEHDGYRSVVTAALSRSDQEPFLEAGFTVQERLHLLTRPVADPSRQPRPQAVLRRGRRADRASLLELDAAAFSPFWHLDDAGFDDALSATPSARLRVATGPGGHDDITGYAITGRAGWRGYLQRLAVTPHRQGEGIGTALVLDGLRWLKRWGAREVLVNTQESNEPALRLYEALGFRRQADGLAVLRRDIGSGQR
jgi:ribosomal protein S18 acetylase RimI-like enzyme